MNRKNHDIINKIVTLAMFLAMGVVLNIVESMIPLPIAIPGIRLGLANTMGLIVLYFYSPKEYLSIGILRVFFVGLLRTGLGSVAFLLSLSGWLMSSLVTLALYFTRKSSIYSLSIVSGMFHQVGQIITVMILYQLAAMINYLPILLATGAISGGLVAIVSTSLINILTKVFKVNKKVNTTNSSENKRT